MRAKKSDWRSHLLVSFFFLGIAFVFLMLFWEKWNADSENKREIVVGKIVRVEGQSQGRHNKQSRWKSFTGTELVYNLDSLRTSSHSSMVLLLQDRESEAEHFDEIILGPDTFIILDLAQKNRQIQFISGDLSASGAGNLMIKTDDMELSADQASLQIRRKEGEKTEISVDEGEVSVRSAEGETLVQSNTVLIFDEVNKHVSEEKISLKLIHPPHKALLLSYDEERQVDFQWDIFTPRKGAALEISSDPSFNPARSQKFPLGDKKQILLPLAPKVWYWRVLNDNGQEESTIHDFTIQKENLVRPINPLPNALISFDSPLPPMINIEWEAVQFADNYTLEIAQNSDLTNPSIHHLDKESFLIKNLQAGDWWWRITPRYRLVLWDEEPRSTLSSFSLKRRVGLPASTLISPSNQSNFSTQEGEEGILFRWQERKEKVSYTLVLSQEENFTNLITRREEKEGSSMRISLPESGAYYWKVETLVSDNQGIIPPSETRRFNISSPSDWVQILSPSLDTEIEEKSSYLFTWRRLRPGDMRIQIKGIPGEGQTPIDLFNGILNETSLQIPLSGPGRYSWKIGLLDGEGLLLGESPESFFTVIADLRAPQLRSPRPGEKMGVLDSPQITLLWDTVSPSNTYTVSLFDPEGRRIGREENIRGNQKIFALSPDARAGSYTVELISLPSPDRSSFQGPSIPARYRFEIDGIQRYSEPVLHSPPEGASFSTQEVAEGGVLLQWDASPAFPVWAVELQTEELIQLYKVSEGRKLLLKDLNLGDYRWSLQTFDQSSNQWILSPSSSFSVIPAVSVLEQTVLEQPNILSPQAHEILDMTRAKDLRFSWENSPGAAYYHLALYPEASSLPILEEKKIIGTDFVLDDLSLLDVGDFILTLQAYQDAPGLQEKMSSPLIRLPFSLWIDIPTQGPKILSDDVQYVD